MPRGPRGRQPGDLRAGVSCHGFRVSGLGFLVKGLLGLRIRLFKPSIGSCPACVCGSFNIINQPTSLWSHIVVLTNIVLATTRGTSTKKGQQQQRVRGVWGLGVRVGAFPVSDLLSVLDPICTPPLGSEGPYAPCGVLRLYERAQARFIFRSQYLPSTVLYPKS